MMLQKILRSNYNIKPGDRLYETEIRVESICNQMHLRGIRVDVGSLDKDISNLQLNKERIRNEINSKIGIRNPNSAKDVGKWIYEDMKYLKPQYAFSGKNYKVTNEILESLIDKNPDIEQIITYRKILKVLGYEKRLRSDVRDGRIHCEFDTVKCPTGRIYTENPNLQQCTSRVKRFFVPDEGYYFIEADYKSMEMSIFGAETGEDWIENAISSGSDLHRMIASKVLQKPLSSISLEDRQLGKVFNYGIMFGMDKNSLSDKAKVSVNRAEELINNYWDSLPNAKKWKSNVEQFVMKNGYIKTHFGRCRKLDVYSFNRSKELRRAINTPIQGGEADIIKMKLVELSNLVGIDPVLEIHDAFLFRVSSSIPYKEAKNLIKNVMEGWVEDYVNLFVDISKPAYCWEDC